MSKLERAIIAFGVSAAALGGALGFINNGRDQVLVATIPTAIANLWAITSILWTSIENHTKALIAAIDRRTKVLAGPSTSEALLAGRTQNEVRASLGLAPAPKRYKTGRLKAVWPAGLLAFREYLTAPFALPPSAWPVPKASYPMDGNDVDGDCTIAGAAHFIAALNKWLKKRDHVPTAAQVKTEYFKETGGQDTGLVEANVLKKWQTVGLFGHKIAAYAPIKPTDLNGIKQAIAFYGGCYLGILCPDSAQRQFEQQEETGKQVPWTYEGEQTDDGHCVIALGYTADGLLCATWGAPDPLPAVLITWDFLAHYLEEAWVILSHELVEAKKDTLGVNVPALQADIASL